MGLFNHLESNAVQTRVLFSGNITRHPAYRHYLDEHHEADWIMYDSQPVSRSRVHSARTS